MHRILALTLALAAAALPARASYVCRQVDVPGSSWTQGWQVNNAGQVAFGSDLGGSIYSAGSWEALPPPPASSGISAANLVALGLNDYGNLAGSAFASDGASEQSFLLTGGTYRFLSYRSFAFTEARSLNDSNIIAGIAYTPDAFGNVPAATGFIYNPSGAAPWPQGFSEATPVLNGTRAVYNLPGQMNTAGVVVGSARFPGYRGGTFAYVYDPAASPPTASVFRIDGRNTKARGINQQGDIVGAFYNPADGTYVSFFRDHATGQDTLFTCPELKAAGGIFTESINDSGTISGDAFDATGNLHGFIGYPDVLAEMTDLENAVTGVGPGHSLEAKIDAAKRSCAAGDAASAAATLNGFISEVAAQAGRKVPAGQAASFTSEAEAILGVLACP